MCMCVFSHVRVRAHVCQCISVCVAIAQHNYQGGVSSFLLPNECWADHSSPQLAGKCSIHRSLLANPMIIMKKNQLLQVNKWWTHLILYQSLKFKTGF